MNKYITFSIIILSHLALSCSFQSSGNESKLPESGDIDYVESKKEIELGYFQIEAINFKSAEESNQHANCKAEIRIIKEGEVVNQISYPQIEAVGGYYGIYLYPQLIEDHAILVKIGDYDGEMIIINIKGEINKIIGGSAFYDSGRHKIYSIYSSDVGGVGIYNLENDSVEYEQGDVNGYPTQFYRINNNRIVFKMVESEDEQSTIWEIEPELNRVMQLDLYESNLKEDIIPSLFLEEDLDLNCN